jgi:hypothetical protein
MTNTRKGPWQNVIILITLLVTQAWTSFPVYADDCLPREITNGYPEKRIYQTGVTWTTPSYLPPYNTQFESDINSPTIVEQHFKDGMAQWYDCKNVPRDNTTQSSTVGHWRVVWSDDSQMPGSAMGTIRATTALPSENYSRVDSAQIQINMNLYDAFYDVAYWWTECTSCNSGSGWADLDMQSSFAHEYGHALGFDHVQMPGYVMGGYGDNPSCRILADCERQSLGNHYNCIMGGAIFTNWGAFSDTAYCETYNEIGTDSLALFGFPTASSYPDSGSLIHSFSPHGGTATVGRYKAPGVSGYSVYEWREFSAAVPITTGPFVTTSRPDDYYVRYAEDSTSIDSLIVVNQPQGVTLPLGPNPPLEANCADIIVYSSYDSLADPIYQQILTDVGSTKRVRKIIAPLVPNETFPNTDAQACKDSLAYVVARNAAWNTYCTAGTCQHYPVSPGPEVYIVGDSYGVPRTFVLITKWVPVGVGTMMLPNWEFVCTDECKSDMLIYDIDDDGIPDGPLSRIPAVNVIEAKKAAWAAQDVNRNRNRESGWHVSLLAGKMWGDPYSSEALLDSVKLQFRNILYTDYPMLKETSYPPPGTGDPFAARYSAFSSQVASGVREVFGYGGMTSLETVPGWFIRMRHSDRSAPYDNGKLATKARLVAWMPACLLHASYRGVEVSGSVVKALMFGDTTRTMVAASVSQMDIGWFKYHQRMSKLLANARETAGGVGNTRSVARVAYDAIMAAIAEGGDMAVHALSLSTWGSYTLVGRGTSGGGGGCPVAEVRVGDEWVGGNTILGRSPDGELGVDVLRCDRMPSQGTRSYELRIRENEREQTILDRVALRVVDHDPAWRAMAVPGVGIALGQLAPAQTVYSAGGVNLWRGVDPAAGKYLELDPGDTVLVDLPRRKSPGGVVTDELGEGFDVESQSKDIPPDEVLRGDEHISLGATYDSRVLNETGILVQTPDEANGWRTRARIYPREHFSESIIDSVYDTQVRLIAIGKHSVRALGRVTYQQVVSVPATTPVKARHSSTGDVLDALRSDDVSRSIVGPQDTLLLEFATGPIPDGQVRDVFLESRGVYATVEGGGSQAVEHTEQRFEFSLGPALPNPAVSSVQLVFTLAQVGVTTLNIYDVRGRVVRTLVDGQLNAGPQSAVWDGRDNRGRTVGAGVFFYRLRSGSQQAERKLAFVPR